MRQSAAYSREPQYGGIRKITSSVAGSVLSEKNIILCRKYGNRQPFSASKADPRENFCNETTKDA